MKRVIYILATIVAVSCSNEADYDAQGTFEATEVVISAEGTGRILNFDIVEGEAIESNSTVGATQYGTTLTQKTSVAPTGGTLTLTGKTYNSISNIFDYSKRYICNYRYI